MAEHFWPAGESATRYHCLRKVECDRHCVADSGSSQLPILVFMRPESFDPEAEMTSSNRLIYAIHHSWGSGKSGMLSSLLRRITQSSRLGRRHAASPVCAFDQERSAWFGQCADRLSAHLKLCEANVPAPLDWDRCQSMLGRALPQATTIDSGGSTLLCSDRARTIRLSCAAAITRAGLQGDVQSAIPVDALLLERFVALPERKRVIIDRDLARVGGVIPSLCRLTSLLSERLISHDSPVAIRVGASGENTQLYWATWLANGVGVDVKIRRDLEIDALLVETKRSCAIIVAERLPVSRKAYAIFHELAHRVMDHVPNSSYGLDPELLTTDVGMQSFERQEREADALAELWTHLFDGIIKLVESPEVPNSDSSNMTKQETCTVTAA